MYKSGAQQAFEALGLSKFAKSFAPGIPISKPTDPLPKINIKTLNRWTLAVQEHVTPRGPYSEKTRTHYDLRLVDPDSGKAHSWALPKARLPEAGERVLAVQTFTHTPDYALHFGEHGTQTIGKGYGKGAVTMALKAPTDIVEASRDHIKFNTYEGKDLNEYLLRRTNGKSWLLMNTTSTRARRLDIPESKPRYREVTPDKINLSDDTQIMQAKIDGAHNSIILEPGKQIRVFSYRPTERTTGVIEHTHRFLPGFKQVVPDSLPKIILRADLAAVNPATGRAMRAVDTGAVLNSGVWKSRDLQTHTPLRAFIHDVVSVGARDLSRAPYADKLKVLKEVSKALPFLELPPMAQTLKEKEDLLRRIRMGKEPLTSEGVVLWPQQGAPVKSKFKPDFDVYVRDIFPEKGPQPRPLAGGFEYAWSAKGPVVGKVGTGFPHALKSEMVAHPEAFIDRVAKVQAQEKYEGGALRTPAFKEWHLDKGTEKVATDLYHYALRDVLRKIKITKELLPVDATDPSQVQDYRGRGRSTEEMLRSLGALKPGDAYKNYGVYTTPVPPRKDSGTIFSSPHVKVPAENLPKDSVLAYRHPKNNRRMLVPATPENIERAMKKWTPEKIQKKIDEHHKGPPKLLFQQLPQVISFEPVKVAEIRDATQKDIDHYHVKDLNLHTSQYGTPHKVKIDRTPEGTFRGLISAEPGTGKLTGLYVSPQHRRQGVATALMNSLDEPPNYLRRLADNKHAEAFYEALGFNDAETYHDPERGKIQVMRRSLEQQKHASDDSHTARNIAMGAAAAAPFAGLIGRPSVKVTPTSGQEYQTMQELLHQAQPGDVVLAGANTSHHGPYTTGTNFSHAETIGPAGLGGPKSVDVTNAFKKPWSAGSTAELLDRAPSTLENLKELDEERAILLRPKQQPSPQELEQVIRDKLDATRLRYATEKVHENALRELYVPKFESLAGEASGACRGHICSTLAGIGTKPNEVVPGKNYMHLLPGDFARSEAFEPIGHTFGGVKPKLDSKTMFVLKQLALRGGLGAAGAGLTYGVSKDPVTATAVGAGLLTPSLIRPFLGAQSTRKMPQLWKLIYGRHPEATKKILSRSLPLALAGGGLTYLAGRQLEKKLNPQSPFDRLKSKLTG